MVLEIERGERKFARRPESIFTLPDNESQREDREPPERRPPGEFMDDHLAEDTARFLLEVRQLAERRRQSEGARDGWERR